MQGLGFNHWPQQQQKKRGLKKQLCYIFLVKDIKYQSAVNNHFKGRLDTFIIVTFEYQYSIINIIIFSTIIFLIKASCTDNLFSMTKSIILNTMYIVLSDTTLFQGNNYVLL